METLSTSMEKLTVVIIKSHSPLSFEKPSHLEGTDSFHSMEFHSNPLTRELHLPKFEVNKFDGSDLTGWVTQMEHYFYLHGITNDSIKLHIDVLYLDFERWKWWK